MNRKIALSLAVGAAIAISTGYLTADDQYHYRYESNRTSKKDYDKYHESDSSYFKKTVPNYTYILLSFILGFGITYAAKKTS